MMNEQTVERFAPVAAERKMIFGCVGIVVMFSVFVVGLGLGFGAGRWTNRAAAQSPAAVAASPCEGTGSRAALCPHFDLFWEAMDLLYRDFYGELPSAEAATYAAIQGVVDLAEDPNTSFLPPEEAEIFRTNIEGSFEGIGARVAWDETHDAVIITEPFENQPAWQAGLRRNDVIIAVDGESIVGTSLRDTVQLIRGPKGTTVVLTVRRDGEADPFEVTVTRERIEIPTITTDSLGVDGKIAYVRLTSFNENAGQLVREAVRSAVQRDAQALIFDLRGNSGGLLREAVRVTSVFLEDDTVLLERFSDGSVETYRTQGRAIASALPMIVLVNAGSASASEIVAGALQDSGRARLLGSTTFGKGSVQLPHTLSNGAILRVTIARWFTPKDRTIDGIGLQPDIVVQDVAPEIGQESGEEGAPQATSGSSSDSSSGLSGADPQLEAAVRYLESSAQNSSR